jgi:hypothetical protein
MAYPIPHSKLVLDAIAAGAVTSVDIRARTGLSAHQWTSAIGSLKLKGIVVTIARDMPDPRGKRYKLAHYALKDAKAS